MKKIFLLLLLSTTFVFSQAVFNLQGVLRLPTGKAAVDGNYEFKFLIYDQQTGGTALNGWVETQTVVVQNGIYNILVGNKTSFTGLAFDKIYYIGMSVGAGDEMLPRIRLTAAPYALSLQGTRNKVPNSGAMQFDTEIWHKSADTPTPKERIKFVNNGETIINSKVKDKDGFIQPTGAIIAFGGSVAPAGWWICDGSEIDKITYSELFAVLGDNYKNTWDNKSSALTAGKFRIPNLQGRTPVGVGTTYTSFNGATGLHKDAFGVGLGTSLGFNNSRLSIEEMPSHSHTPKGSKNGDPDGGWDWQGGNRYVTEQWDHNNVTPVSNTGGSQPHNNMQPYLGINYIIKY